MLLNSLEIMSTLKSEITSFAHFTRQSLRDFFEYVLTACNAQGKPLSAVTKKKAAQVVKEILILGAYEIGKFLRELYV